MSFYLLNIFNRPWSTSGLFEQGYILTNAYFSLRQTTGIQAAIRQQIHEQQRGGNLLKAEVGNGQVDQVRVPVTFTGTRTDDKRTGITYERVSDKLDLIAWNVFIKITSSDQHFFWKSNDYYNDDSP